MKKILFNGCCTAIATPFSNDGINFEEFKKLIETEKDKMKIFVIVLKVLMMIATGVIAVVLNILGLISLITTETTDVSSIMGILIFWMSFTVICYAEKILYLRRSYLRRIDMRTNPARNATGRPRIPLYAAPYYNGTRHTSCDIRQLG